MQNVQVFIYHFIDADNRWWIANTVFTPEEENNLLPNGFFHEK